MAAVKSLWVVVDPSPNVLREPVRDQLREICFEEPIDQLPNYIRGSKPGAWEAENTRVYLKEAEAKRDAEERLGEARKTKRAAIIAEFDRILKRP